LYLVAGELKPNQFLRLGQCFVQTGQLIKCAVKIPQRLETVEFWWQMSNTILGHVQDYKSIVVDWQFSVKIFYPVVGQV